MAEKRNGSPEPYMFFFDHNNTNFYYVAGL